MIGLQHLLTSERYKPKKRWLPEEGKHSAQKEASLELRSGCHQWNMSDLCQVAGADSLSMNIKRKPPSYSHSRPITSPCLGVGCTVSFQTRKPFAAT